MVSPNATKNKAGRGVQERTYSRKNEKRWVLRYHLLSDPGPRFLRRVVVMVWSRLQRLGPGVALACLRVAE